MIWEVVDVAIRIEDIPGKLSPVLRCTLQTIDLDSTLGLYQRWEVKIGSRGRSAIAKNILCQNYVQNGLGFKCGVHICFKETLFGKFKWTTRLCGFTIRDLRSRREFGVAGRTLAVRRISEIKAFTQDPPRDCLPSDKAILEYVNSIIQVLIRDVKIWEKAT